MTIRGRGTGAGGTLIDCAHRVRHFAVLGSNVTLEGMRLVNGSAHDGACGGAPCALAADGGCVLIAGAGAKLVDCDLSGCTAEGRGGAVFVTRGDAAEPVPGGEAAATLRAVVASGGRATYGGAVWADMAVVLGAGTTFRLCTAFHGGGVFVQGPRGSLTASRATVEGCRAANAGGGVHAALNASIRLEGVAVQDNVAGAYGGGVYIVEGGTLVVSGDSAVQDNTVRNPPFSCAVTAARARCGVVP